MKLLIKSFVMAGSMLACAGLVLTAPARAEDAAPKPAPAPAPKATPATSGATSEGEATDQTSDGAMKLFAKAMKEGDFNRVVEMIDPSSEVHQDFVEMAEAFDPATANPNVPPAMLQMIKDVFTKPWEDVEIVKDGEKDSRAQFTVKFMHTDEATKERVARSTQAVQLNEHTGTWKVLAGRELLQTGPVPSLPIDPSATPGAAPAQPAEPAKPE